jgi:hypothetical protein
MSPENEREKRREESPEWHRARAKSLRAHGFTKMAPNSCAHLGHTFDLASKGRAAAAG